MRTERWGVLFDLDGVLVDSAAAHKAAWREVAAELGVAFDEDFFVATFGLPNAVILPKLAPGRTWDEAELRHWGERKEARFRELARSRIDWLPGARELLAALTKLEIPRGLFTSTPASNLRFYAQHLELDRWIPVRISVDEVARGKPAPDGYLEVARRLGIAPESGVVIEDAPAGLAAGRAGGFATIGVATSYAPEHLEADLVVADLHALDPAKLRELALAPRHTPPTRV